MAIFETKTTYTPPIQTEKQETENQTTEKKQRQKFPDVFPQMLQNLVHGAEKHLSLNAELMNSSFLAAAIAAMGRKFSTDLPFNQSTCTYLVLVADAGAGKSPPMRLAFDPLRKLDRTNAKQYEQQMEDYAKDPLARKPTNKQRLFQDFTVESLTDNAKRNIEGLTVFCDEISGWMANMNRYNSGGEVEFWLQNFNGDDIAINRKGSSSYLKSPNISVFGTITPKKLDVFNKGGGSSNGFLERILFCVPEIVDPIFLKMPDENKEGMTVKHTTTEIWGMILQRILDYNFPQNEAGEFEPNVLKMENEALGVIINYINSSKRTIIQTESEFIKNIYSKMHNYVIRFAIILAVLDYACNVEGCYCFNITKNQAVRATRLADYFTEHALYINDLVNFANALDKQPESIKRLYGMLGESFTRAEAIEAGAKLGINRTKLDRILPNKNLFKKNATGNYTKVL